ncbi:MAG: tyrosine-type recombinase/integrase [Bdellovibrionales bacterium]|nr:tyrosine-type recombinase/integrase [Bdellovibrionales bacterium]
MPHDSEGNIFHGRSSSDFVETTFEQVIENYIKYYADGSGHTARAKRVDLRHFLKFLQRLYGYGTISKVRISDWDHSAVQQFVDYCLERGEAPSTVSRRLATIKHMGRTLSEKIAGFTNPAKEIKSPRIPTLKPKGLAPEEIQEIRERAEQRFQEKKSFARFRNETLFLFLLETGLRADEVRLMRLSQLGPDLSWIRQVRTKGRRFRNVYIPTRMRDRLILYLEARKEELSRFYPKLTVSDDKKLPLFVSSYGAVPSDPESFLMGAKSIWRAINELSAEVHLHPHLLRHSFALGLLDNSQDIRLVAQALGHSDVRITMRYTERYEEDIARAVEGSKGGK